MHQVSVFSDQYFQAWIYLKRFINDILHLVVLCPSNVHRSTPNPPYLLSLVIAIFDDLVALLYESRDFQRSWALFGSGDDVNQIAFWKFVFRVLSLKELIPEVGIAALGHTIP